MNFTEPAHPPYGLTYPRQLNRWLDVNAQNGPLTRARYNVIVPAFSFAPVVTGGHRIVGAWDYLNTFNCSFLNIPDIGDTNYVLCISWSTNDTVESDKYINPTTYRYLLSGVNDGIVYCYPEQLTTQIIPKKFRIEIWSSGLTVLMATDLVIATSKLTTLDYRYGQDTSINPLSSVMTDFLTDNLNLPFAFPNYPDVNLI